MMQWVTILKKEMLEYWRNFKWIWVPIVFILFAIMDPLSTYYLPKIIETVGGMPEGAVFEMPEVPPNAALMMSLNEFSMFGVLVIILISMGLIAGERKSGVAELVLVKPVGYFTYISSKWFSTLFLMWISYVIGMLTSWYYVNLLFGEISFGTLMKVVVFYGLWLTLVLTITIFFNTLFKTPGIVGFVTIATMIVMFIFNQIFSNKITWFPNNLSKHIVEMLETGTMSTELWGTSAIIVVITVILLFSSYFTFRNKEKAN